MKKKKLSKIIFLTMAMFFAITISKSVSAREMTVEELGKELDKIEKSSGKNIDSYYVIGEHVFTSRYTLNTRDIMFAARSISMTNDEINTANKVEKLKEMTIHRVQRDFTTNGWKILSNYVGETKLENDKKLSIHYIDYDYVYEEVNTDNLLKEAEKKVQKNNRYTVKFDEKEGKITFTVLDRNAKISEDEIAEIIVEILKENFVSSVKIGNVTINKDEATKDGNAKEDIWNKIKDALKTLAQEESPENVKLGELLNKKLDLIIELDSKLARSHKGNTSESYAVEFTYNSVATLDKEIPDADKEELKSKLNYHIDEENDKYTISGKDGEYTVSGEIIERENIKGFGNNDNKQGFYFPFVITLNEGIDVTKVKVKLPKSDKDGYNEFDNSNGQLFTNRKLTVLMEVEDPESVKYRDIIIIIDDVETKIRIDFTGLKLRKTSKFTVSALEEKDAEDFPVEDSGWYDTENGYQVTVTPDENEENKYKVTGILPIFDDSKEDWAGEDTPFDNSKNLYYLGLLLKLVNAPEGYNKEDNDITVKFFHNENEEDKQFMEVDGDDFANKKELYILKALCENAQDGGIIPDDQKVFTITVDLDGEKEADDKYAPHTVTIDWSGLKLQCESNGDAGSYELASSKESIQEDQKAVDELEKYGYKYEADSDVKIDMDSESQPDREPTKDGLKGDIKQQTLDAQSGFKDLEGYFVPIKVYFPGKDIPELADCKEKWTIILNTEEGKEKEYKPTDEEYKQGWVLVLFKIKNEENKQIKYKIDFDGSEGKAYIPGEYAIDYDKLNFKTENSITYKYTDKNGNAKEEKITTYQGDTVELKKLDETDYRKLDGWYKETEKTKVDDTTYTTTENEDVTLVAHWNLNTEKFVEEVVKDLNSTDTTYSEDFSGQFKLEQNAENKNEITIKIESPNVKLSTLAETSIPGTIAYILQNGEIKDVTLTVGDSSTTFNKDGVAGVSAVDAEDNTLNETGKALKEKVITDAKSAFNTELQKAGGTEADATMDQIEFEGKSFTLKIGEPKDETIKLVDAEGKELSEEKETYTFKFDSDFTVVDAKDSMGPSTITEALGKNDYEKIYVESDVTEEGTLNITTEKDVTIEPVENAANNAGLMTASETPKHTIKVQDQDYAVDVKSTGEGTLTISDLKITGGKYAELKVEKNAKVNATNIDVSGTIEESKKAEEDTDDMHAAILVEGILTANNITNNDEKYSIPTIALVTSYEYTNPNVTGEEMESPGNKNIHPDAKVVTSSNMTKNDKYHIITKEKVDGFDSIEETYYGSFYYVNSSNSQIYYMSIIDRVISDRSAITFFKVYTGDETIDIHKLGYTDGFTKDGKKFEKLTVDNTGKEITQGSLARDVLQPHVTNKVTPTYVATTMNVQQINGLEVTDNKVSGTLTAQDTDGKFVIPVTLTSECFQDNISTVKVTNPNNETKSYTYSSSNDDGIAMASTTGTMNLKLEAIKTSKITGTEGKKYKITVDIDGEKNEEFPEETYTINYDDVKTAEEIINEAAENTHKAKSLTVKKNNKINGFTEDFTYKYDFNEGKGLTHYKSNSNDEEEYTFRTEFAGVTNNPNGVSVVAKKGSKTHESNVYLKNTGWEYCSSLQPGTAVHELTMLTDVMKASKTEINAIKLVEKVEEKENTYKVTLNSEKYEEWIKKNYLSNEDYNMKEAPEGSEVIVEVALDENNKYLKSIKTISDSSNNKFDVEFSDVDSTEIKEPKEFLANENEELTDEDIKEFYEAGKEWWSKHTGSSPAEG